MKLKLDENLGRAPFERFQDAGHDAGHDVATVTLQAMNAATDPELVNACTAEQRALVTLDLDFSNPLRYPPRNCAGVIVLRLPPRPSHTSLMGVVDTDIAALRQEDPAGRLWIVEQGRLRIYDSDRDLP